MKKLFSFIFFILAVSASAQIPISQMPTHLGSPGSAWVPIVMGSTNYKTSASNFGWDKMDSAFIRNDSLFGRKKNGASTFFIGKISSGSGGGGTGISGVFAGTCLTQVDDSTLALDLSCAGLDSLISSIVHDSILSNAFDTSTLRGIYMDTSYAINDSTTRYCKDGTCWDITTIGGGGSTGGDTAILGIVVDSTGQPQHLVLYGAGNNHIGSNAYFHYDSVRHKLVIANKNTSFGGNGIKLGVNGNGYFNGTLKIGAYTLPATDGLTGQTLQTNGSGAVSWQSVGTPLELQHEGVDNGSQSLLNIAGGINIAISDNGTGTLTITNTASTPGWPDVMAVNPDALQDNVSNFHNYSWDIDSADYVNIYSGKLDHLHREANIHIDSTTASYYAQVTDATRASVFTQSGGDSAYFYLPAISASKSLSLLGTTKGRFRMDATDISASRTHTFRFDDTAAIYTGRVELAQGASVSAANDLTLGYGGNTFSITGATQINAITTANWQAGSVVNLIFASTPTIKHNTAGGAGTASILLSAGTDFTASANDVLTLLYDGTNWHETARKLSSSTGVAAGSNRDVQWNNSGVFGADHNYYYPSAGSLVLRNYNVGVLQQNVSNPYAFIGLRLKDTIAATSGNQMFSPALTFTGNGFRTSGSSSQENNVTLQLRPIQGTTQSQWGLDFLYGKGTDTTNSYTAMSIGNTTSSSSAGATLTLPGSLVVTSDATIDNGGISTNSIYHLSGNEVKIGTGYVHATFTNVGAANTNNIDGLSLQRSGTFTAHNIFEINRNAGALGAALTSSFTNGGTTFTYTNALEWFKKGDIITVNSNNYTITGISGTTVTFTPSFSSSTSSYAITFNSPTGITNNFGVSDNGIARFGLGSWTTQNALVNIGAGGTYLAPLNIAAGTNVTTAISGNIENDGTDLWYTTSTPTQYKLNKGLSGSATLDFASTNAQNSTDLTITVTGAADGDVVSLGVPNASVNANSCFTAWVSASNTVTVRFNNYSAGAIDPASGTFKIWVRK